VGADEVAVQAALQWGLKMWLFWLFFTGAKEIAVLVVFS
jgi:hypothetical protein